MTNHYVATVPVKYTDAEGQERTRFQRVGALFRNTRGADGVGAGVVGCQCKLRTAKQLQHHCEVTGGTIKVLKGIVGIDAKVARSRWHQLAEANSACA